MPEEQDHYLCDLPLRSIDKQSLGTKLREIGRSDGASLCNDDVA